MELRISERYPILLEAWGINVLPGEQEMLGATLSIPTGADQWLHARYGQYTLSSVFPGVNTQDRVLLPAADTIDASIMWSWSF